MREKQIERRRRSAGVRKKISYVVNGTESEMHLPWHTYITTYIDVSDGQVAIECGGSLISPNAVITGMN